MFMNHLVVKPSSEEHLVKRVYAVWMTDCAVWCCCSKQRLGSRSGAIQSARLQQNISAEFYPYPGAAPRLPRPRQSERCVSDLRRSSHSTWLPHRVSIRVGYRLYKYV